MNDSTPKLIQPILKSVDCYDLAYGDLPEDVNSFSLEINASIGEADSEGADLFRFAFCSYKGLPHRQRKGDDLRLNIIDRFDWKIVEAYIKAKCDESHGHDWPDVCQKLCKWSFWEYEGYRQY